MVDEVIIIKRNRALAYLRTGRFDSALEDLENPHMGDVPNEKAISRAVESLYQVYRFKDARDLLRKHESTIKYVPEECALLFRAEMAS